MSKNTDRNHWAEQRRIERLLKKGYRGFPSKAAYTAHYSDPANYADEMKSMEDYTREAEADRGVSRTP